MMWRLVFLVILFTRLEVNARLQIGPYLEPTVRPSFGSNFVWAKVDNFDPDNNQTWKQYYYERSRSDSNVNILYIGGEGPNSLQKLDAAVSPSYPGLVEDLRQAFGAAVYTLEHRYYQSSYPVKHPRTAEDFKYLSSQQALADIENFIKAMNKGRRNQKWITIGGSYAGMLAIWHRQLYPQSTVGTIGSSGPVHAVANFTSFFMVAQIGYKQQYPKCYEWLKKAFAEFKVLLENKDDKLKKLYPVLAERYDIEKEEDAHYFAYHVVSDAYTQIQFRIWGICGHYSPTPNETPVQTLARLFGHTADDIESVYWRSWMWQVCNEFGFFYSPDDANCLANGIYDIKKVYGVQCKRFFGPKFTYEYMEKQIQKTLDFYQMDKPYPATNAIITNSVYDPWSGQGLKKATSDTVKFFWIRNGTHCHDLYSGSNPDVYESRKVIKQEVARWIRESRN
ncbi:unnamed protein product [Bursaphelenchus xylophilus]|uniref:(pine wood nematode) hypothetical protein n=1 Tax=Bursaphelenchus xylophilus TaxID=6326 RepID=A0A1I7S996_BURXY|nr:unnamed protein product [Bursaphelenchus xylophilus]CAG9100459.1 unnamed protein product [Bursaphelenchus xylophilus]